MSNPPDNSMANDGTRILSKQEILSMLNPEADRVMTGKPHSCEAEQVKADKPQSESQEPQTEPELNNSAPTVSSSDLPKLGFATFGYASEGQVIVTPTRTLEFMEAQQLYEEITKLMGKDYNKWIINLERLTFCNSITLGWCTMILTKMNLVKCQVVYRVSNNSFVHRLMCETRLDQILKIELV